MHWGPRQRRGLPAHTIQRTCITFGLRVSGQHPSSVTRLLSAEAAEAEEDTGASEDDTDDGPPPAPTPPSVSSLDSASSLGSAASHASARRSWQGIPPGAPCAAITTCWKDIDVGHLQEGCAR